MYLKTLTIRGFKSFASKTTFDFEPGITSVIGPNGSGKSNVVDALSWVMGEQGAKNLRGGKMEDVIFAGTTGRSALGRAQVELTIDNSDGTLPIDYSEVTISRTLFRSGGSEYEINGESARLLDIQELLSDSGLGREMHVIVGQGQLDKILEATPEERRGFIEEAAGILKHRRRKERSERKLESMRANLDRIRDLSEEVRRQLGPLSKQAETARKAQSIQHDVRDATARLLADEVVSETQQLQELVDEDKNLERRQRALVEQLEHSERTAEQLNHQHSQISQAATSAREHRYQLTALTERYKSLRALVQERHKTASRPPVASSGLTPEEASKQLADNEQELQTSKYKLESLSAALSDAQEHRSSAERHARIASETYTQLVREEADQQKALATAESRKTAAETKLASLTEQLQRLVEEDTYNSSTAQETEHELETQQHALAEAEAELQRATEEKTTADEAAKKQRTETRTAEDTVNRIKTQLSAAEARLEILEQSLQPSSGSALAAIYEHMPQDVSEVLEIEPGWETAIAALLAGSTDRAWVNSREAGIAALETLQHHDADDIRIFMPRVIVHNDQADLSSSARPATSVVAPRNAADKAYEHLSLLLASAVLVENIQEAQVLLAEPELWENNAELRIATRQGHIFTASWADFHGDGSVSSLERRAEYDRAVAEQERIAGELDQAEDHYAKALARLETLQETIQQKDTRLQDARSQATTLAERIALQQRSLKKQQAEQNRRKQQHARLEEEVSKASAALDEASERYDATHAASHLADEDSTGVQAATEAQQIAEQEASAARAAETEARLALRTAENVAQQAEQRLDQSRRRLSSAKIAQQEYQRALIRQQRTVRRLSTLLSAVDTAIGKIEASVQRADSDYHDLEAQRTDIQTRLDAADQATTEARAALNKVKEHLHERRLVRQEREIKLEQLHERSITELGYSHEYLVANFGPNQPIYLGDEESAEAVAFNRKEQQKRLRSAKRNLSALGKINPLALEEFAAVQERHEYLNQQLSDLEESRKDLIRIIEDVDATVLKVFTAAYEDTAEQFKHVFATVFPGGEGKLSLTEPDNMLETGIEVEARPAGKKVKRLSLLSGGERSLAAIAMLVSIFKARPSPFYVMDEVEAALDDTNLSRLLTIFKELQEDSQLIIITHQKRTMEISDALYGVSMRGDGVSQVVSQKLHHVSSE